VYDPDKAQLEISQKYPDLPAHSIYYHINNHFLDQAEMAWKERRDFILETNFRDYQLMETVALFRRKGYQTSLAFFLLLNETASLSQVKTHVNQGGHHVDPESIKINYE